MKFLIITIINMAFIAFAKAGYFNTPFNFHDLHTNTISSYSSHQTIPGATSFQSFQPLGLPVSGYTPRVSSYNSAISTQNHIRIAPLSFVPRQPLTYHPQLATYPIHNQPALITQNPSLIHQQYPAFIHQQPTFISPIPPPQGLFPQNPIPTEPQQISNIPQGAQVDTDTVSVEAVRTNNNDGRRQQINNEDDDSVTVEAANRSLPDNQRQSNNTTQTSENSSTTESNQQGRNPQQQQSVEDRLKYLNDARRSVHSRSNVISRNFFGNPSVFARFDLQ